MSEVQVPLGVDPTRAQSIASTLDESRDLGEEATGAIGRICEGAEIDPSGFLTFANAATELLDATAHLLRLKADQIRHADAGWPDIGEDGWVTSALRALNNITASCPRPAPPGGECLARPGDPGGTLDIEERLRWINEGTTPEERGRAIMSLSLELAYDDCVTAPDEFLTIDLGDNNFIVVLPGVTDLSSAPKNPIDFFYGNDDHQTARATWVAALRSSLSTSVDDNLYARLVADYLADELPAGANVALVGHSFGADTALDLAADPAVNGGNVTITHVVAAGYYSTPQLPIAVGDTQVLAYQNRNDLVVAGESMLDEPTRAGTGVYDIYNSSGLPGSGGFDLGGIGEGAKDTGAGIVGTIWDGLKWTGERVIDPDPRPSVGATEYAPGQTNVVFDGGFLPGVGHDEGYYIEFAQDDPMAAEMAISLGEMYPGGGEVSAVDVTLRGR